MSRGEHDDSASASRDAAGEVASAPRTGPQGVVRGDLSPTSDGASARRELSRVQRWAIHLGPWIIRALAATWRVRTDNETAWRTRRANHQGLVFSLWHGQLLPLLAHHHDQGVVVLISEHRDGELIAQIAHALGFRTVRGSTSRGAARALLAVTRELEAGHAIAITPDGPRGPRHSFAPGALVAANRVGVPVIAVGVAADRAWRLKSWDAFMIPKPFARVRITYSDSTFVDAPDARVAGTQGPRFEALMQETISHAEALASSRT